VCTDKGQEFLNKHFQDMLRDVGGGIQFHVCRNPDLKCAVVERVQRTIRDRLYTYFIHKNTYSYIHVLPKFVKVHSTTGLALSRVTDPDVQEIWKRMDEAHGGVRVAKAATFRGWGGNTFASAKRRRGFRNLSNRITATKF